jgi:hypothetical protein
LGEGDLEELAIVSDTIFDKKSVNLTLSLASITNAP